MANTQLTANFTPKAGGYQIALAGNGSGTSIQACYTKTIADTKDMKATLTAVTDTTIFIGLKYVAATAGTSRAKFGTTKFSGGGTKTGVIEVALKKGVPQDFIFSLYNYSYALDAKISSNASLTIDFHFPRISFATQGATCSGKIGIVGTPAFGQSMGFTLTGGATLRPTLLMVGFSDKSWLGLPLPFDLTPLGAKGCAIHTGLTQIGMTVANPLGNATVNLPIPAALWYNWTPLFFQWVQPSSANTLGLVFSDALKLH